MNEPLILNRPRRYQYRPIVRELRSARFSIHARAIVLMTLAAFFAVCVFAGLLARSSELFVGAFVGLGAVSLAIAFIALSVQLRAARSGV